VDEDEQFVAVVPRPLDCRRHSNRVTRLGINAASCGDCGVVVGRGFVAEVAIERPRDVQSAAASKRGHTAASDE